MTRIKKQYQPIAFSLVLIAGVLIGISLSEPNTGISNYQIHQNSKINNIIDSYKISLFEEKKLLNSISLSTSFGCFCQKLEFNNKASACLLD